MPHARSVSLARPGEFADAMAPRTLPEAAIVSAIDHALWDVHAQAGGVRLADAVGGVRSEQIPVYANFNRRTRHRSPEGFAASARDAHAAGFAALKVAPFDEVDREACAGGQGVAAMQAGSSASRGPRGRRARRRLMVDCHWRFDEPPPPRWFRRPPGSACTGSMPAARTPGQHRRAGEAAWPGQRARGASRRVGGRHRCGRLRALVEAGAYDVVMPDVKYFGGLMHVLRACPWFASRRRRSLSAQPHRPGLPCGEPACLRRTCRPRLPRDAIRRVAAVRVAGRGRPAPARRRPRRLPPCGGLGVGLDGAELAAHTRDRAARMGPGMMPAGLTFDIALRPPA